MFNPSVLFLHCFGLGEGLVLFSPCWDGEQCVCVHIHTNIPFWESRSRTQHLHMMARAGQGSPHFTQRQERQAAWIHSHIWGSLVLSFDGVCGLHIFNKRKGRGHRKGRERQHRSLKSLVELSGSHSQFKTTNSDAPVVQDTFMLP